MPNPNAGSGSGGVYLSRALTNISIAYLQSERRFIADKVFPRVTVNQQGGRYFTYTKNDWFITEAEKRAPSTESAGSGWRIDNTPTFYCETFAVHKDLDRTITAQAEAPINMERDATRWVTNQMMLKRDIDWAATFFGTGLWGKDLTGVSSGPTTDQFLQWDQAGADPIEDVTDWSIYLAETTAIMPEDLTLVMGPEVFAALKNHSAILDRIKYTERGIVTEELLRALFGVGRVLVAWAVKSTAAEGKTAVMDFIYGKAALLVYTAPSPSLLNPSGGYIFTWPGEVGNNSYSPNISRYSMPLKKSNRIEAEMNYDMKVVASDTGVFFSAAVA